MQSHQLTIQLEPEKQNGTNGKHTLCTSRQLPDLWFVSLKKIGNACTDVCKGIQ